ncbi:MAG: glycosyltransferase family 1 protein [Variovorax sp.]|nr:MAG: glycosyltransferase family 1 protein [Variovorax sp.]
MKLVFFTHPPFLAISSMTRYASWLVDDMKRRGHEVQIWTPAPLVQIWTPAPLFYRLPVPVRLKKWMGYIDQYVMFPLQVKWRLVRQPLDTLYVFADHALGPWVPLVAKRPHVVHCHDFLAQDSALGRIPHNPVSQTGRLYQRYIRNGFSQARAFIAISRKTKEDLMHVVDASSRCEVVYNGVNPRFQPTADVPAQRELLGRELGIDLSRGFVMHVGVNTWYKNRQGVLAAYEAWQLSRAPESGEPAEAAALPLLMIGPPPPEGLADIHARMSSTADVHFLSAVSDEQLAALYGAATVFLFPSIAEGFGWPIVEAMASGCPVITTGEAPMTEVAGSAAVLIPVSTLQDTEDPAPWSTPWAARAGAALAQVANLSPAERQAMVARGLAQARHFDSAKALDRIEAIYASLLERIRAR